MTSKFKKIVHRITLAIFLIVSMFPIYWMLNTSFKTQKEVYSMIPTFIPKKPTLSNYIYLLTTAEFNINLRNSFIIAITVVFLSLCVAYPASYSLARIKYKGKRFISRIILFCYMLPSAVLYIPLYIFVSRVGLSNTMAGLILIYPTFTLPFMCWVLIPHLASVPKAIEEAAIVDGCSQFGIMFKIVFPLALPGIISSIIFSFSVCWGEYLYALVNVTATKTKTFPVAISELIFGDMYPWGNIMAAAIMGCIPIFLVYLLLSRFLIGGVAVGGVKG